MIFVMKNNLVNKKNNLLQIFRKTSDFSYILFCFELIFCIINFVKLTAFYVISPQTLQNTLRLKEGDMGGVRELGDSLVRLSEDSPQVRAAIQTNLASLEQEKRKLDSNVQQVGAADSLLSV